jgi:hypothetical protein
VPCRDFLATWATYTVHQGHAGKREAFLLAVRLAVKFLPANDFPPPLMAAAMAVEHAIKARQDLAIDSQ